MRKVFKIFHRDLRDVVRNPVATIIIAGLCIIPSFYAWINIKACWNPYVNTGNLPVAIVNKDRGAVLEGKIVNVGDNVVEELKKNKDIGWRFVDDWQANYGLNNGTYYALIEIPSDFSSDLISLTTSTPVKPDFIYRVNEKANAIATKITDVAQSSLTTQIKSNFVKTVTTTSFTFLNKVGNKIEDNKPEIIKFKESMVGAGTDLVSIKNYIGSAENNAKSLEEYLSTVKNNLPEITKGLDNLSEVTTASKLLINSTNQNLNSCLNNLKENISQLTIIDNQANLLIGNLKSISTDYKSLKDKSKGIIDKVTIKLDTLYNNIDLTIKSLGAFNHNSMFQNAINSLKKIQNKIQNEKSQLDALKTGLSSNKKLNELGNSVNSISNTSNEISNQLSNLSSTFYNNSSSSLNTISGNMTIGLDNADAILSNAKVIVPQLNALANFGISSSKVNSKEAANLTKRLDVFQENINKFNDKLKNVNNETLDQAINILQKNPEETAKFLSSPINVKQVDVYDAGIFGIGLTPFYTVLAIWVGALLSIALLSAECPEFDDGTKLNLMQKHFGKMLTFMTISLVQTIIVVLGDVYILGINPANFSLLIFMGILTSLTFSVILFTLASLFGNIGKAIAVIIMVFQIAGAGGIYPIQTNPKIFEILQPLWPFTYAIDGFREAIAGPIWSGVYTDVRALFIFIGIFLVLAIIKRQVYKITDYIERKFEESGLSE